MDIKELYTKINVKLITAGKPKIDATRWVEEITVLEMQGKIKVEREGMVKYALE